MSIKDRLLSSYIPVTESGCWLWTGYIMSTGYGTLCIGQKNMRAHRLSYETFKGPIPDGLYVCHSCDVPSCINPDHLWLGTQKDNAQDAIRKGRFHYGEPLSECANGHAFTEATIYRKKNGKKECRICREASRQKYKKAVANG